MTDQELDFYMESENKECSECGEFLWIPRGTICEACEFVALDYFGAGLGGEQ